MSSKRSSTTIQMPMVAVLLDCQDVPRQIAFYRDVLGFMPLPDPTLEDHGLRVAVRGAYYLTFRALPAGEERAQGRVSMYLLVESLDKVSAHLARQQQDSEAQALSWGGTGLLIHDPEGNPILISEPVDVRRRRSKSKRRAKAKPKPHPRSTPAQPSPTELDAASMAQLKEQLLNMRPLLQQQLDDLATTASGGSITPPSGTAQLPPGVAEVLSSASPAFAKLLGDADVSSATSPAGVTPDRAAIKSFSEKLDQLRQAAELNLKTLLGATEEISPEYAEFLSQQVRDNLNQSDIDTLLPNDTATIEKLSPNFLALLLQSAQQDEESSE